MTAGTEIAVVGAGPYGLSLAAHLASRGADFRVFGSPMRTWRKTMPKGMHLKSDGFASSLSAPGPDHTLKAYCAANGLAYHDTALPVPLQTFTRYALDFGRRFAPSVEERNVEQVQAVRGGFRLRLDDGEAVSARKVVLAVGITYFDHLPEELSGMPAELVTHSSAHHDLQGFRGREVAVIGAGSSAADLAALLDEAGASVRVVVRGEGMRFADPPSVATPLQRLRRPASGLGPGWRSRIYSDVPTLFRRLPSSMRLQIVRKHLGPLAPWQLKERVIGRVPVLPGRRVVGAEPLNGRVRLHLATADGAHDSLEADHVIAATGYRSDLRRLPFLGEELRGRIRMIEHTPVLSSHFESSVRGLYFLGPVAATSFGPLMRFMFGSDFAARRLSGHLARGRR